jgi:hypothetical protein
LEDQELFAVIMAGNLAEVTVDRVLAMQERDGLTPIDRIPSKKNGFQSVYGILQSGEGKKLWLLQHGKTNDKRHLIEKSYRRWIFTYVALPY